jgi:surface polysaccharide O-acyltransferase-like enzyme
MKTTRNEVLDLLMPVALFLVVMIFFIATTPNYIQEDKIIEDIPVHVQSPVLEKYGELITKNK